MSIQFKSFTLAAALAAPLLLSACDGSVRREGPPAPAWLHVVRADAERNRLWVLEPEALSLHDNISGRRLRRIALTEPFFVGEDQACAPDIAWDAAGTVFVSSNVLPVLWRIDPQGFEITRIELELGADGDKDVGFTGLSFAEGGVLIAAGTDLCVLVAYRSGDRKREQDRVLSALHARVRPDGAAERAPGARWTHGRGIARGGQAVTWKRSF